MNTEMNTRIPPAATRPMAPPSPAERASRWSSWALWIVLGLAALVAVFAYLSFALVGGVGPTGGSVPATGTTFDHTGVTEPPPVQDAARLGGTSPLGGVTGPSAGVAGDQQSAVPPAGAAWDDPSGGPANRGTGGTVGVVDPAARGVAGGPSGVPAGGAGTAAGSGAGR
jgi:hypothetical protein